jgi:hypothetical protein
VLEKASCRDCEAVTSYLDGYLANAIFKDVRVHARVQSRRGHPATLKAHVVLPEGDQVLDLAPKDHPYFLHMPVWDRPGMMRGVPPTSNFGDAKVHVYWYVPPSIRETLMLTSSQMVEIQDKTSMPRLVPFARAIAKIGYCHAILCYGLDGLRSLALPDIILGRYQNISHFVGSFWADPRPPDDAHVMHSCVTTNVTNGRFRYQTVQLRLFANSGTEKSGMPIYEVIVGIEGRPGASSRRPAVRPPKVIRLTG